MPDETPSELRADSVQAPPQATPIATGETHLGGIYVGPPIIRNALLNSFRDGIAANGMMALNETFAVAAAVSLRASSMAIAMMSSMPMLVGSVGQYLLPALADPNRGRKRYVTQGVAGQVIGLALAACAGWLSPHWAPWVFVILYACSSISVSLSGQYWVAWMGDLMPGSARGRHFAWRSRYFSLMYLSCSLTAGMISRRFDSHHAPWILFFCVFATSALLRSVSFSFLVRQHEPVSGAALEAFSPLRFRPGREFLQYCLATGLFQGAASMSGPFFAVWYLRDLHFNYLFIAISLSLTVLGSIASSGFWGRMADHHGTGPVLFASAMLVAFIPFPYVFSENRYVLWAACVFSGASWGGYNLSNFNHMLTVTDQRHRSHYLAFSTLIIGLLGCGSSMLGGFLATRIPVIMGWRLQSLFLVSGLMRIAFVLILFRGIRRSKAHAPANPLVIYMELPGFRTGAQLIRTVFRGFRPG